jgi:hypothetical protein
MCVCTCWILICRISCSEDVTLNKLIVPQFRWMLDQIPMNFLAICRKFVGQKKSLVVGIVLVLNRHHLEGVCLSIGVFFLEHLTAIP